MVFHLGFEGASLGLVTKRILHHLEGNRQSALGLWLPG